MKSAEKPNDSSKTRFQKATRYAWKFVSSAHTAFMVLGSVVSVAWVGMTGHTFVEIQRLDFDKVIDISTWNLAFWFLCQWSIFLGITATLIAYILDSTKWSTAYAAIVFLGILSRGVSVIPAVVFVGLFLGVLLGALLNRYSRWHNATKDHGNRWVYLLCRCHVFLCLMILLLMISPEPKYSMWIVGPIWLLLQGLMFSGAIYSVWERAPTAIDVSDSLGAKA